MSLLKKSTAAVFASVLTLTSLGTATSAYAHDMRWGQFHRHQHVQHNFHRHPRRNVIIQHNHHRKNDVDAGKVGGVLLGILGAAIVVDALSKTHTAPPKSYTRPFDPPLATPYPPVPKEPHVVYHTRSLEPWTPGWLAWCKTRYRSFNEHTGTFRGYDGLDHFCVPK